MSPTRHKQSPKLASPGSSPLQPSLSPSSLPSDALIQLIQNTLEDAKAEDIVRLELRGKTTLADWMFVASGISRRHLQSIAEKVQEKLKEHQYFCTIEGGGTSDWVLIDAGEVIVHIFQPEIRSYYSLEKMWGDDFTSINPKNPKKILLG